MENNGGESSNQVAGSNNNNNAAEEDTSSSDSERESQGERRPRRRPRSRRRMAAQMMRRVRNLVSQNTVDEDDLDNEAFNYPDRNRTRRIYPDFTTEEDTPSEDEDANRLFEQYVSEASRSDGAAQSTFDVELPIQHSYLGDTEQVKGHTCFEPGKIYEIPVIAHHSWVYPGEVVPMILVQNSIFSRATDDNEGLIFGLYFQNDSPGEKSRYGVTCQVYEKGVDYKGHTTVKSKAYQRFVVMKTDKNEEMIVSRNRVFYAKIKVLPETVLPEPIQLTMSNNLLRQFHNQPAAAKRIRALASASMQWPSFVYDHFSCKRVDDKIQRYLGAINVEPPTDPVLRSFWYARNLPFSEEDRRQIFKSNCVNDRFLIIDAKLDTGCFFSCKNCFNKIAMFNSIFAMAKDSVNVIYCNPAGYMHETLTVTNTIEGAVKMVDRPSSEFSWFPGYAWQIALCATCSTHVGWRFIATLNRTLRPRAFFGLSSKSLTVNSNASAKETGEAAEGEAE